MRRSNDRIAQQAVQCNITEEDGLKNTWKNDLEKEVWTAVSGTARGRWTWQHKTELNGGKWSVVSAPLGMTTHKDKLGKLLLKMSN